MASMGNIVPASPAAMTAFIMLCASRIVAVDAVHHEEIVVGPETVGALCPAGVADVFRHAWAQVEQVFEVRPFKGSH